jgi:hypothetical protein
MITLRYPPSSFAVGLWLGELPDAVFTPEVMVERVVSAPAVVGRPQAQAAAETSRIAGPRGYYGLLGATFTPDGSGQLRVRVATAEREGPPFAGPSVRELTWTGQVGLLREYAGAVIEGAIRVHETDPLGGGELRFDCAAHHLVDSNNYTFSGLAALVTRLLQPDAASMRGNELSALAETYLRP